MAQRTNPGAIPDSLRNFDSLPNSAHVRQPVVEALFGCSPATVWRLVKRGTLKARKLSNRVTAFNVGELRTALSKC
jgi:predicted DNA-binding transcriptional regulator AlpA